MMQRLLNLVTPQRLAATLDRPALTQKLTSLLPQASPDRHLALLVVEVRNGASHTVSTYERHPRHVRNAIARMQAVLRPGDALAKIGWERFAIVLFPLQGEGHALLAANKILSALTTPTESVAATETDLSIGVVLHPQYGRDPEHLLRLAELACEGARGEEARIKVYDRHVGAAPADELAQFREFKLALENNAIDVWFQPQIDAGSGACIGAEALLRWERQPGEFVPPPHMVQMAERHGLTALLTSRVLKSALRGWTELRSEGVDVAISVNLCAHDVNDPELPDLVRQGLATWSIPPERLVLEVTEGSLIGDIRTALDVLHALKSLGCRISIDDFGTGYSSMAYLTRLPLDELKIDQVFVRGMLTDRNCATIVRAITDLAHNLGLHVVAEGVGDVDTAKALGAMGCEVLQGFLISPPRPRAAFRQWVRDWDCEAYRRDCLPAAP
ncbi:MAG: putative bifunctional diguanylate cyclase/phosphodiesterase [Gammaproteobacteria bacterium]